MTDIFISYRHRDSGGHAQLLRDRLVRWFGEKSVFFDRDWESIESGHEFPKIIETAVQGAEVFLAVSYTHLRAHETL